MAAPLSSRRPGRAATTAVGATMHVADVVEGHLARAGAPALAVLELLFRLACAQGRRRTMSDLAGLRLASRTGITRLVRRVQAAGLVARGEAPGDRRATHAALTSQGGDALDAAGPAWRAGLEETLAAALTSEERAELVDVLRRLLGAHTRTLRAPFARELGDPARVPMRDALEEVLGDAAPWGELFIVLASASAVVSEALEGELVHRAHIAASRIAREAGARDRRVFYATLTREGAAQLERAHGVWSEALRTHVAAHLTAPQQDRLTELLQPLRRVRTAA